MNIRKERSKQLHLLSHKKKRAFYEGSVGKTKTVLFEQEDNEGYMFGFTDNYVKVKFPYDAKLTNTLQTVHLDEIDRDGIMKCSVVEEAVV